MVKAAIAYSVFYTLSRSEGSKSFNKYLEIFYLKVCNILTTNIIKITVQ